MTFGVHATRHQPFNGDAQSYIDMEMMPCFCFMKER